MWYGPGTVSHYCRVISNTEHAGYRNYLCFTITKQINNLNHLQKYSDRQRQIHDLITSLHSKGLGYRKIAQHLNEQDIKTERGKIWKNTNVHSELRRGSSVGPFLDEREDKYRKL